MIKTHQNILKLILLFIIFNSESAIALQRVRPNFGISVNLAGLFFGEYGLGVSTFLTRNIQIAVDSTYYNTTYISPEIQGWQTEFRINYFFAGWRRSGFYIGGVGGLEAVDTKIETEAAWKHYSDPTWGLIPGYAWNLDKAFTLMIGLKYGYSMGDTIFSPEMNFVMSL